jgi:hypothetical protein
MTPNDDLQIKEPERKLFFDLAERLEHATDAIERQKLKEILVRMAFGNQLH